MREKFFARTLEAMSLFSLVEKLLAPRFASLCIAFVGAPTVQPVGKTGRGELAIFAVNDDNFCRFVFHRQSLKIAAAANLQSQRRQLRPKLREKE